MYLLSLAHTHIHGSIDYKSRIHTHTYTHISRSSVGNCDDTIMLRRANLNHAPAPFRKLLHRRRIRGGKPALLAVGHEGCGMREIDDATQLPALCT